MVPSKEYMKEVVGLGEARYQRDIRPLVDTDANFGKVLVLDVDTGDYAIGPDRRTALEEVSARNPNGRLYGVRIGYPALSKMGGGWNVKREHP